MRLHGYPVERQRGRRLEPGEDPAPVLLGLRLVALGQPAQEVLERTPRRRRQGTAAGQRRVLLADLAEHLRRAPPVEQHMVERPDQQHLVVAGRHLGRTSKAALVREPRDGEPHQRGGTQVQARRAVADQQQPQLVRALLLGQCAPVVVGDR